MNARFDGKVVLVTGGSRGIGRATAGAFAREGALVVVAGRTAAALAATVREIEDEGGKADHVVADVSVSGDVAALVQTIVQRHGGLHVAINNAGILSATGPVAEIDEDQWSALLAANLTGVFLSMKHQITHMRAHGGGAIVNISSNIGPHQRLSGVGAYAASKAGVSVLTRTAALDHIGDGVRINAVSPGATDTPMSYLPGETEADRAARLGAAIPAGRMGGTGEIAAAALWLASDESAYVVGHDLVIDGGSSA